MRHTRKQKSKRAKALQGFIKGNPWGAQESLTPAAYGRIAFVSGWNAAMNEYVRHAAVASASATPQDNAVSK